MLLSADKLIILTVVAFSLLLFSTVKSSLKYALLTGFLLRASLAIYGSYIGTLPYSEEDAVRFEELGWQAAQNLDFSETVNDGGGIYISLIAIAYYIFGRVPVLITLLNSIFGSLLIINVYKIVRELKGDARSAIAAAWCISLFPSLILFSAVNLREAAVWYPFSLGLLWMLKWWKTRRIFDLLKVFLAMIIGGLFHSSITLSLLPVLCFLLWHSLSCFLRKAQNHRGLRSIASLFMLVTLIYLSLLTGFGLQKFQILISSRELTQSSSKIEIISRIQSSKARDRASYLENLQVRQPLDFIWQLPVKSIYFMLTPFPWMIRTPGDLIAFSDALLNLLILSKIFQKFKKNRKSKSYILFLITSAVVLFALAIGTSNYGTALRHRAKLAVALVAIASLDRTYGQKSISQSSYGEGGIAKSSPVL